jgi:DNA-binding transcriptional LysR family regulator
MSQNNVGKLYFVFARERGIDMFCSTYSTFHQRFPGITLEPHEMLARQQMAQIAQGYADLGLVTITDENKLPGLEYELIRKEPMILAVPRVLPEAAGAAKPGTLLEDLPVADLKQFKDLPYVLVFERSTMRQIIDKIFRQHHFTPYVLFESASIRTLETMVKTGLACTIVSANYYKYQDQIAYYRLPGDPQWELDIVYKKGAYLSKPMLYYKELMQQYFREKAPLITKKGW